MLLFEKEKFVEDWIVSNKIGVTMHKGKVKDDVYNIMKNTFI